MPDLNAVEEVAKQLATDLGASFIYGTNVFHGKLRPQSATPVRSIFVISVGGGGRPLKTAGKGIKVEIRTPRLEVWNRGEVDAFADAETDARLIRNTLKVMKIAGVASITLSSSDPVNQTQDDQGSFLFTNPIEVTYTHGTNP